jgi:hypothetical protein
MNNGQKVKRLLNKQKEILVELKALKKQENTRKTEKRISKLVRQYIKLWYEIMQLDLDDPDYVDFWAEDILKHDTGK